MADPMNVPKGFIAFPRLDDEEMAALVSFAKTAADDESYTVPGEMMSRLLLRGCVYNAKRPGWYYLTDFGRAMLAAAPPSDAPGEGKAEGLRQLGEAMAAGIADGARFDAADINHFTSLSPSPAEQGAREVSLAQFIRRIDGTHTMSAAAMAEKIVREWLPLAPLAAGRVGVAEANVEALRGTLRAFQNDMSHVAFAALTHRVESLAGPLVAGEVEPVAWELSWGDGRFVRLYRTQAEADADSATVIPTGRPFTIRPLVYADTAKGG